ncbi:succinic semialdehyde dehydrogenase [Nocardia salmonicida]|uniref:succinic semialdehyde dehydrogenase n=1 Tax=Nocardia salmonicida TaxID=53431 RepID=UPI0033D0F06B
MTSTAPEAERLDVAARVGEKNISRLTASIQASGPPLETIATFTGKPFAHVPQSTAADVVAAFETARAAQREWASVTPKERSKIFVGLHDRVIAHPHMIDLIQAETGKSRYSAFEETLDVAGLALYYGRNAPRFLRTRKRKGALPLATRVREHRRPKGVVAIISPFNYPLSLGVCDVIPALLAGNAVVHKPDSQTALTALHARELLIDAGLPADLWQIVVGAPDEVGPLLIEHADHICFTGSTASGKRIAEAAAGRLIGCTLELGGKNPMLVLEDADLDKAAAGAVRACFSTTGQLCLSIERLYVRAEIYDTFVSKLVDRVEQITLGSGFDFSYDIGSLSSQRQLDTVRRQVDEARSLGANILAGGRPRPDLGPFYYEPTILTQVTEDMEIFSKETFGPVVSIYKVNSDGDAVTAAERSEFGLNASIWTRDEARARSLADRIHCGTVNINEGYASAYASNDATMGGMKSSGQGRRHGEVGLHEYTELQTVASQRLIGFDPPESVTLEENSRRLTAMYKLMKKLRLK